ncbi:hypothetical protein [Pseudaestuariivita atlantica]|uniref:Cytochrome c domain-containing protein n=1 Tax=Pseudaestuariivita atlantica TaxID=1317121 RepID=A0A0L1JNT8_9RHOB|nr:hypothetical protein [Pseudaestuariivita atlantica]KNG93382.1 hypothetical protein ATO11_13190 [Pseudaestuariivita atlantica]
MKRYLTALTLAVAMLTTPVLAEGEHGLTVTAPDPVNVSRSAGLAAWDRLHEVFVHPRCANCHVDAEGVPMWTGPSYGAPGPHGMAIVAGESRIGAETLPCQTCHVTSTQPNTVAHAAPHTGMEWQLAPVEFQWVGKSPQDICAQVRDPDRNGGRDGAGLVEHILHDAAETGFITWGFNPGGGREPAPGDLQSHLDDTIAWVAAGMPCPEDGQ